MAMQGVAPAAILRSASPLLQLSSEMEKRIARAPEGLWSLWGMLTGLAGRCEGVHRVLAATQPGLGDSGCEGLYGGWDGRD